MLLPFALMLVESGWSKFGLADPVRLRAGNGYIDSEHGHAHPLWTDLDGDGKKELVVGQYGDGKARIYPNIGTPQQQKFDAFTWLQAGGKDASIPGGCCVGFGPQLVDFDGDGEKDMLSGSYEGPLFVFKGLGKGEFAAGVQIKRPSGKPLVLDYTTSLSLSDWNGDSKPDLIVGTISGPVFYLENKGDYTVAEPKKISSPNGELFAPDGGPCWADWDGDGIADLFLGREAGGLDFYKGRKGGDFPLIGAPVTILPDLSEAETEPTPAITGSTLDWDLKRPKMRPKPSVCDWNGDGKLDLLVGDYAMVEGKPKDLTDAQKKEFQSLKAEQAQLKAHARDLNAVMTKKVFADLNWPEGKHLTADESVKFSEAYYQYYKANQDAMDTDAKLEKVFEKIQPMMPEPELHGFVWLFLHK